MMYGECELECEATAEKQPWENTQGISAHPPAVSSTGVTENSVRNDTQRVALEDKVSQVISEDILWLISRNYFTFALVNIIWMFSLFL